MSEKKIIGIKFGESESDIICWMRSLPRYTINKYVNMIIISEAKNEPIQIPCDFSYTSKVEPMRCKFFISDAKAKVFIQNIPKGEVKSTIIKIIRKNIRKSKNLPPMSTVFNEKKFDALFSSFIEEVEQKEKEYRFILNKNKKISRAYNIAYENFEKEFLQCYKNVDLKRGDYNLKQFDYKKIIDDAFRASFGFTIPERLGRVLRSF